jgi:UTP--glucose-1-phosphate uridylyltransferase
MRPVSRGAPKELVSVGGTSLIVHAFLEAAASGFEQVFLVLSPQKQTLLPWLRTEAPANLQVIPVLQPSPLGLADAQDRCRKFLEGEPFAVLLPDTVFAGEEPGLLQVKKAFAKTGRDTLGLIRVRADDIFGNCGAVETEPRKTGAIHVLRSLSPKKPGRFLVSPGETRLRTFPRSIFHPHYFQFVDTVRETLSPGEELDDVPVLREMIQSVEVIGVELTGRGFDAGTPEGLGRARSYFDEGLMAPKDVTLLDRLESQGGTQGWDLGTNTAKKEESEPL